MCMGVDVPEYAQDRELVASEDLARDPAFWLAHLMLTIGDPGEPTEPYGVDAPAYDEMVDRLGDPEPAAATSSPASLAGQVSSSLTVPKSTLVASGCRPG
ncbi:hypothetical protein [Streptomyces virginiae]|uniref:hypothetical protein n=1 Tax=Streptomyces virginiae TaxID=1961 RepID=UPI0022555B5A|nr:hypothetical protein [Streptomyces virginiae]MCX5181013.1 hypothetical protein [Streptomyces virginiae]